MGSCLRFTRKINHSLPEQRKENSLILWDPFTRNPAPVPMPWGYVLLTAPAPQVLLNDLSAKEIICKRTFCGCRNHQQHPTDLRLKPPSQGHTSHQLNISSPNNVPECSLSPTSNLQNGMMDPPGYFCWRWSSLGAVQACTFQTAGKLLSL